MVILNLFLINRTAEDDIVRFQNANIRTELQNEFDMASACLGRKKSLDYGLSPTCDGFNQ